MQEKTQKRVLVLYKSKYGASKRYAQWLSETLGCDLRLTAKTKPNQVESYDTIVLIGGLYASAIAGIKFFQKNYPTLKNKQLIAVAVGASPHSQTTEKQVRERNFMAELRDIPWFYCRGAWQEEKMTFFDRTLCNMLKKNIEKKDPSTLEPWVREFFGSLNGNNDWTSKDQLNPVIERIFA